MINEKDPKHLETKRLVRRIGKICLTVGILFEVIGIGSFISIIIGFSQFRPGFVAFTPFVGLSFFGLPLIGLGVMLMIFGYSGEVARYTANEMTPVKKDVVNYMVDGTKDSLKTVASTVKEGVISEPTPTTPFHSDKNTITCHHCLKENDADAKFCDNCGKPILDHKVCSQCQSKNDLETMYCNRCGSRFL